MASSTSKTTARRGAAPETHDYECDEPGCEFVSTGWETKTKRDQRGRLHRQEHETGEPMVELGEFIDADAHRAALAKAGVK